MYLSKFWISPASVFVGLELLEQFKLFFHTKIYLEFSILKKFCIAIVMMLLKLVAVLLEISLLAIHKVLA